MIANIQTFGWNLITNSQFIYLHRRAAHFGLEHFNFGNSVARELKYYSLDLWSCKLSFAQHSETNRSKKNLFLFIRINPLKSFSRNTMFTYYVCERITNKTVCVYFLFVRCLLHLPNQCKMMKLYCRRLLIITSLCFVKFHFTLSSSPASERERARSQRRRTRAGRAKLCDETSLSVMCERLFCMNHTQRAYNKIQCGSVVGFRCLFPLFVSALFICRDADTKMNSTNVNICTSTMCRFVYILNAVFIHLLLFYSFLSSLYIVLNCMASEFVFVCLFFYYWREWMITKWHFVWRSFNSLWKKEKKTLHIKERNVTFMHSKWQISC